MSTGQTLVSIQPEEAVSPLGKAIARLLQEAGLEIDIDQFGAIDEMAQELVELKSLEKRFDELTNDFSTFIDSMPIADRPAPNRYTSSITPEAIGSSLQ